MKKYHVHSARPVIPPKHMEHPRPKPKSMGFVDKTFIIVALISIGYILFIIYQREILALLQRNPTVWMVVSHIFNEVNRRTVLGLFYACFFGSLFFIMVPLELLFLYYSTLGYPEISLVGLAIIAITIGLVFDYMFGWLVGKRVLTFLLKEKFKKFHDWINKWGGIAIFFGTALPFPIQPVSVIIGAVGYSFKRFVFFAFSGLLVKYITLVILSRYMMDALIPWLQGIF